MDNVPPIVCPVFPLVGMTIVCPAFVFVGMTVSVLDQLTLKPFYPESNSIDPGINKSFNCPAVEYHYKKYLLSQNK